MGRSSFCLPHFRHQRALRSSKQTPSRGGRTMPIVVGIDHPDSGERRPHISARPLCLHHVRRRSAHTQWRTPARRSDRHRTLSGPIATDRTPAGRRTTTGALAGQSCAVGCSRGRRSEVRSEFPCPGTASERTPKSDVVPVGHTDGSIPGTDEPHRPAGRANPAGIEHRQYPENRGPKMAGSALRAIYSTP